MKRERMWFVLGVAEVAALVSFAWIPTAHRFPWPGLMMFAAAFLAYAGAAWSLSGAHGSLSGPDSSPGTRMRPSPRTLIWIVAVGARLSLLPLAPELSDDINRYLWDGHVQAAGVNPYASAPDAGELAGLRTAYHDDINNPSVPTIYPPAAQLIFLLVALAGSKLLLLKVVWIACDLATGFVLARIAAARGLDDRPVLLLWLWSPLLLIEVAWSGHLEPLGLLALTLAIYVAGQDDARGAAAGVALAFASLTKFAPAAALPALVRRRGLAALAGFVATVVLLYAPYAGAGTAVFDGLRTYSEHWWFMKGPFAVLETVTGDPLRARGFAGVIVVGVIGWTTWKSFELDRTLLWVLGTGMILTPTLHPWYVLWILPMAILRRSRAWLLLSGLAFIGYFGLGSYQDTGQWSQPGIVRAALWLPFLAVLIHDSWTARSIGDRTA